MSVKHIPFIVAVVFFLHVADAGADPYNGPIFDAHGHLGASFDRSTISRVMKNSGVTRQILMARYYNGGPKDRGGNDKMSLRMAASHPGRFFPLAGMQRPVLTGAHKWHNPTGKIERLLQVVEKMLASGKFYGIGEVIVRHFSYSSGPHAEVDHPIYSTFMKRLSDIAMRFDVPIVIHMEGAPGLVADFSRLIDEYKTVRYVWAHNCGRSHAPVIREMLTRHPNLFCDLASMTNLPRQMYGTGLPRMEPYTALMEKDGIFFPPMKKIYEDFPDRFTLGMDVAHARGMNNRNYSRRVNRFRQLLGQLSPSAAKLIAEGNALRIFKLKSSKSAAPWSEGITVQGFSESGIEPGAVQRNVTYCKGGRFSLKMDLHYPGKITAKMPVVVYVHGGGFVQGNKVFGYLTTFYPRLHDLGFVIAAVNYRLAAVSTFPAMIEDVKCSIRFLRAKARELGIDPDRIGAMGHSAGGTLVSLLGVADGGDGLEGNGGHVGISSRVQAVVGVAPVLNLARLDGFAENLRRNIERAFGENDTDNLRLGSPANYVSRDDAPFLIFQGDQDTQIRSLDPARHFNEKLTAAGVESRLVVIGNASHKFRPDGGKMTMSQEEMRRLVAEFFGTHFK